MPLVFSVVDWVVSAEGVLTEVTWVVESLVHVEARDDLHLLSSETPAKDVEVLCKSLLLR